MQLIRIRCTNCGAEFENVEEGQLVYRCTRKGCGAVFAVEQGKRFLDIDDLRAQQIQRLRQGLKSSLSPLDKEQAEVYAKEILAMLPEDFRAKAALCLCRLCNAQPLPMRHLLEGDLNCTEDEFLEVFAAILSRCAYRELLALSGAVKHCVSSSAQEWCMTAIEERKEEIRRRSDDYADIPRDVFICHSSSDADKAQRVVEVLEADGNTCWISSRNLISDTQDYWEKIFRAIERCRIFLVMGSEAAMLSQDVQRELEKAEQLKKPRLEIKLDAAEHTTLFKHFFDGVSWIEAAKGVESAFPQVKERICKLLHPQYRKHPEKPVNEPVTEEKKVAQNVSVFIKGVATAENDHQAPAYVLKPRCEPDVKAHSIEASYWLKPGQPIVLKGYAVAADQKWFYITAEEANHGGFITEQELLRHTNIWYGEARGMTGVIGVFAAVHQERIEKICIDAHDEPTGAARQLGQNESFKKQFIGQTLPVMKRAIHYPKDAEITSKAVVDALEDACLRKPPLKRKINQEGQGEKRKTKKKSKLAFVCGLMIVLGIGAGAWLDTPDGRNFFAQVNERISSITQAVREKAKDSASSASGKKSAQTNAEESSTNTVESSGAKGSVAQGKANVQNKIVRIGADSKETAPIQSEEEDGRFPLLVSNQISPISGKVDNQKQKYLAIYSKPDIQAVTSVKLKPNDLFAVDWYCFEEYSAYEYSEIWFHVIQNGAVVGYVNDSDLVANTNLRFGFTKGFSSYVCIVASIVDEKIQALSIDTDAEGTGQAAAENKGFVQQFIGSPWPFMEEFDQIDTISGATHTSVAVWAAIRDAYQFEEVIKAYR